MNFIFSLLICKRPVKKRRIKILLYMTEKTGKLISDEINQCDR